MTHNKQNTTTQIKPFNLKEAIEGKPLVNRQGKPVKFIAYVPEAVDCYRLIVLDCNNQIVCYYDDGSYIGTKEHFMDVFMAPTKRTVWVNLYSVTSGVGGHWYHYNTEEDADSYASPGRINGKSFPIEIEV